MNVTEMDGSGPSNWNARNNIVEDDEDEQNDEFLGVALLSYAAMRLEPRHRIHNSILTGELKVQEYLNADPIRMFDRIRMTPNVFIVLCTCLKERNLLEDSRGVSVEEQVFIFLSIMAQGQGNRAIKDDFQHSGQTISRYFTDVLKAVSKLRKEFIQAPNNNDDTPSFLVQNAYKYLPWFKVIKSVYFILLESCF